MKRVALLIVGVLVLAACSTQTGPTVITTREPTPKTSPTTTIPQPTTTVAETTTTIAETTAPTYAVADPLENQAIADPRARQLSRADLNQLEAGQRAFVRSLLNIVVDREKRIWICDSAAAYRDLGGSTSSRRYAAVLVETDGYHVDVSRLFAPLKKVEDVSKTACNGTWQPAVGPTSPTSPDGGPIGK